MKKFLLFISCILLSTSLVSQASVVSVTNASCYGLCNGAITLTITGGTMPYTISSNTTVSGCQISAINNVMSNTITINGLCGACYYTFDVLDASSNWVGSAGAPVLSPNALLLNVSPDPVICYGQTTQIFVSGSGGISPYTYTWNPSSLIGGGPHSLSPTVQTQYVVSMSDANGCTVNPKVITINVRAPLTASGYSTTACSGDSVTLIPNITSLGNGGPYTYNWSQGSTTSSINVAATFSSSPNTYSVAIYDGCTVPSATAIFTINVGPPLTTSLNISAISCATCCDGSVQLSVSSGTIAYTVSLTPTAITSQTATSLCAGVYTYCATNSGCSSCKVFTITNSIGVKEYFSLPEINIFPNPSNGNIKLQSSENISQLNYELFDVLGNKIDFGKTSENIFVDVPDGVYILVFRKTDNTIAGRKKINIKH